MKYNIHKYIFAWVQTFSNKNFCVFISLEWTLYVQSGNQSSFMESAMFGHHDYNHDHDYDHEVALNWQNKHESRGVFF